MPCRGPKSWSVFESDYSQSNWRPLVTSKTGCFAGPFTVTLPESGLPDYDNSGPASSTGCIRACLARMTLSAIEPAMRATAILRWPLITQRRY
jgi:hypothetical protein